MTGPPWESKADLITAPAAVLPGSPSAVKASEHDVVTEPERFGALAGSSWKSLPGRPLKSFDCLASIPHWYVPLLHVATALTVKVVVAEGARDRLTKSAELDVKLADPGAPVITKPAGTVIWTDPSVWGVASFVTANAKEVLAPAVGLDGDTVTAKHLPDEGHEAKDVDPAADAASIATASTLAASTPKITRATVKPAFRMVTPSSASTDCERARARRQDPALPASLIHRGT